MREVPAVAAGQWDVFTTRQALAATWTPSALKHAARVGDLERLRNGAYATPFVPTGPRFVDDATRLCRAGAAVALTNPRVPLSHATAAAMWGIELLAVPGRPCASLPRGWQGDLPGVHLHRAQYFPGEVLAMGSIRLTCPARAVVDLARESGADAGVVAADSALRAGLVTDAALASSAGRQTGWPGIRSARRAIAFADGRAESALESVSRLRFDSTGIPPPTPQTWILDRADTVIGRVDFYWPEYGVVGEADGLMKYDGEPAALRDEKLRQERLEQCGLIVVRWGWSDLAAFETVAARLRAAFARGKRPGDTRSWRAANSWYPVPVAS